MDLNEINLIERLKKGDEGSFIYLVDHYNKRLYGYAITLANDHATAEDILQNVFLRTWEKRKKLNINTSLQSYLLRSVYNEFINLYKKKRSTMVLEQKYFKSLERSVVLHDESSFEKVLERVMHEVQQLPPKCREVFVLSRKEGLTNHEISEHLNISVKTVEAQITRAFSILRDKLGRSYSTIFFFLLKRNFS